MSVPCDPQSLATAATPYQVPLAGLEQSAIIYLLCQIANQSGGGGGAGTVTSFSSGNLAPLFTTSVANPNTTPVLSFAAVPQAANLFYVGPAAGGAAVPTFRSMVTADLGTALTPQFASLGVGTAAVVPGVLDPSIKVLSPVNTPGVSAALLTLECVGGNPYMVLGTQANNNGAFIQYDRVANRLIYSIWGAPGVIQFDNTGSLQAGGYMQAATDINTTGGIFICQAQAGITQLFDIGAGNTQIQFTGGIATGIA